MTITKCVNGHYFDVDLSAFCPTCGAEPVAQPQKKESKADVIKKFIRGERIRPVKPKGKGADAYVTLRGPITYTPYYQGEDQKTQAMSLGEQEQAAYLAAPPLARQKPVDPRPAYPPEQKPISRSDIVPQIQSAIDAARARSAIQDDGATKGLYQHQLGAEPAVGWLVCVKGPHFGQDFRLLNGKNHIGRENTMEIALTMDTSVSRVQHATVIYNQAKNEFIVTDGGLSRNPVLLNGEVVVSSQKMAADDVISLGESELVLIRFCNDERNWIDLKKQQSQGEEQA